MNKWSIVNGDLILTDNVKRSLNDIFNTNLIFEINFRLNTLCNIEYIVYSNRNEDMEILGNFYVDIFSDNMLVGRLLWYSKNRTVSHHIEEKKKTTFPCKRLLHYKR